VIFNKACLHNICRLAKFSSHLFNEAIESERFALN
jgi:hypothetical protein